MAHIMKSTANFEWTLSKAMAFIILIGGTVAGLMLKDSNLIITSIVTAAGLIAAKTGAAAYIDGRCKN